MILFFKTFLESSCSLIFMSLYIISSCLPCFVFWIPVFFPIFIAFFPLIQHPSLQPGCDPMTAPVPVPMLLFPHQVRWIYLSLNSIGTVFTSAEKGQTNQRICNFTCLFVTRLFDPKSAAAAGGLRSSSSEGNLSVAGDDMSSREAEVTLKD